VTRCWQVFRGRPPFVPGGGVRPTWGRPKPTAAVALLPQTKTTENLQRGRPERIWVYPSASAPVNTGIFIRADPNVKSYSRSGRRLFRLEQCLPPNVETDTHHVRRSGETAGACHTDREGPSCLLCLESTRCTCCLSTVHSPLYRPLVTARNEGPYRPPFGRPRLAAALSTSRRFPDSPRQLDKTSIGLPAAPCRPGEFISAPASPGSLDANRTPFATERSKRKTARHVCPGATTT